MPLLLLFLLLLSGRRAWAAPVDDGVRARARKLAYAGIEAYAIENYRAASQKLGESFRLLPVPSVGLWSARALVKLGQLAQAEERYRAVASVRVSSADPALQRNAQADAEHELRELVPRVPRVSIELAGAVSGDVEVRIDGVVVRQLASGRAQSVDPGRHVIVGTRGSDSAQVVLNVAERDRQRVWLRFTPLAANADRFTHSVVLGGEGSTQNTLRLGAWAALTAGGAGLTTSLAAYWLGRRQFDGSEQRERCRVNDCSPAAVDAYDTWRSVHIVSLISAGVLGAAGVSLLLISRRPADSGDVSRVALEIGPASAALRGRF